ncbi:MAG: flavodoxin family protein [Desulfobulbaceae bacterium]|nr:flavodoxin family protein [Desulfobulbaceae bacterium]
MNKVLILEGSPRRGGNSQVLIDAVVRGIVRAGGKVERIRVAELKVAPCIGCGGCDKTGHCVVKDDMTRLYEKIVTARCLILASPVYFYSLTAQLKAVVDRGQALWSRKHLQAEKGLWQEDSERKGYLVAVAATMGARVFEGSILTAKYFFDATGFAYGGELLVRGIDQRGEMASAQDELTRAEAFGVQCFR